MIAKAAAGFVTSQICPCEVLSTVTSTRDGSVVRTDAGNVIYDLRVGPIDSPGGLDTALHAIPGVVETGLFVGRCDLLIIASAEGTRQVARSSAARG